MKNTIILINISINNLKINNYFCNLYINNNNLYKYLFLDIKYYINIIIYY